MALFSAYADSIAGRPVPPGLTDGIKDSVGFALQAAGRIGGQAGAALANAARAAFIDGFHAALIVGGAVAVVGAICVVLWLPARARRQDIEAQEAEYSAERSALAPTPGT